MKTTLPSDWLPDAILFHIFSYLGAWDLIRVSEVSKRWNRVGRDKFLWKRIFLNEWKITTGTPPPPGKTWFSEFKRLNHHVPVEESETHREKEQVLHISFSNDGKAFASSSKNGIKLWHAKYPATMRHDFDTYEYNWEAARFSQFNKNDTFLLACGRTNYRGTGEIVIFEVRRGLIPVMRTSNDPYDFFSAWYDVDRFLSSRSSPGRGRAIWMNNVSDVNKPTATKMFRFRSHIGSIMVANSLERRFLIFTTGSSTRVPHIICFKNPSKGTECLDHYIDMESKIIGLALSPDEKYLYVNSLPYPTTQQPTPDIVLSVVDLLSLRIVGSTPISHKTLAVNDFVFLDVCKNYVSSSSEDSCAYVGDRYYGNCLAKLPHAKVVNCVVFNPIDSEILISGGNDIKIWRSRNRMKELERTRYEFGI